jgi:hypothetical protein
VGGDRQRGGRGIARCDRRASKFYRQLLRATPPGAFSPALRFELFCENWIIWAFSQWFYTIFGAFSISRAPSHMRHLDNFPIFFAFYTMYKAVASACLDNLTDI